MANHPTIEVLLLGGIGVGKTSYLQRLNDETISRRHVSTKTPIKYTIPVYTNYGWINFEFLDSRGQPEYNFLSLSLLQVPDTYAVMLMIDRTQRLAYQHKNNHLVGLRRSGIRNLVVAISKSDIKIHKTVPVPPNIPCFDISAKHNTGLLEPLLQLAKQNLDNPNLVLINPEHIRQNRTYLLTQIKWIREHPQDWPELEDQDTIQLMVHMSRLSDHQIRMILLY